MSALADLGVSVNTPVPMTELQPNDTRYGFIPIWPVHGLHSHAFKARTLPANEVFPLRIFPIPILNSDDGAMKDVPPADQVTDLYNIAGGHYATDFPELAKLKNESMVETIIELLTPEAECEMYPAFLGKKCSTCWIKYLKMEAPTALLVLEEKYQPTAEATREKLLNALINGVGIAKGEYQNSVKQVRQKQKAGLSDQDYECMRHCHLIEEKETGSALDMSGLGAEIAKGIGTALNTGSGITKEGLAEVIAGAISPLQETIEQQAKRIAELEGLPPLAIGDGVRVNGRSGIVKAKVFKRYTVEFADSTTETLDRDKLEIV